eukprot:6128404-Alexandrium_andersonii.AAC.1
MHDPPFQRGEHAWGSATHRVLVFVGRTMNAYWGKSNRSIVNRIRANAYGWSAGGPSENTEYLGGTNAGSFEFLQYM